MNANETLLDQVYHYLSQLDRTRVPVLGAGPLKVSPLAQGEYNINFHVSGGRRELVLRLNIGTQIDRDDQIVYEYRALKLLQDSGVTPRPYYVDDTRTYFDRGLLLMEYLPGRPLDYQRDLNAAAALLARIHQVGVATHQNHLIVEQAPLTLIYTECQKLLATYLASNLADGDISSYLRQVLQWAEQKRSLETYYQDDPWPCIVNTEVNSGNFIVNPKRNTIHLVDWEMPRWGDPSQDLAHFCSPLTTLWKTSYRMTTEDRKAFIAEYCRHIGDRHLRDTLAERLRLRNPFVYLRGISWSAMGWVAYQTRFDGVKNQDTWNTLQRYMKIDFIRSLFDPFLKSA